MSNQLSVTNIPQFQSDGLLPPGIYSVTWEEFKQRYGMNYQRKTQIKGLERAMKSFKQAGCTKIYVDGSFITNKKSPDDYDALYDLDEVNEDIVDSRLLDSSKEGRKTQKKYYEGEFFPAFDPAERNGTKYLDFFQKDKDTNKPKGILLIELR